MSLITPEELKKILPKNKEIDEWCKILNEILPKYKIDTRDRISAFVAQCAHESGGFTHYSENLNYSAAGLRATFGKYFPTNAVAQQYARKPEKIANRAYANRMGNGNEASGDGWKYRGAGLIQLTGKANHSAFAASIGMELSKVSDYMKTKEGAVESACWFWRTNDLNRYADTKNIVAMTKKINGGTNGLSERIDYYETALASINSKPLAEPPTMYATESTTPKKNT